MRDDLALLDVLLHGEVIGTITHVYGDRNIFSFSQEYIDNPLRKTMSLSFKDETGNLITDVKPTRTRLPPFFSNLLPEGTLRDYLASHANVNAQSEFYLLAALGQDLPGALKVRSSEEKLFKKQEGRSAGKSHSTADKTLLHFSLAGVQLKFSANWGKNGRLTIPAHGVGGGWIVKLPSQAYPGVPENEYSMMELARQIGIEVPETALISIDQIHGLPKDLQFLSNHAFMIKRFDRSANKEGIHIEDFAQVFNIYSEKKYHSASYRNIAEVIWSEIGEKGIIEFMRRFIFNALIGNGDMHLKNWSLIYPDGRKTALAPAYDFVSTIPYLPNDQLALSFAGTKSFTALDFDRLKRFADKADLPEALVLETAHETIKAFKRIWRSKSDLSIDRKLRDVIDHHLKSIPLFRP